MKRFPFYFTCLFSLVCGLWGSGVIPAIIPAAVPALFKIGNGTKFQIASSGAVSGDCANFDAGLNITGPGTGAGCGAQSTTVSATYTAIADGDCQRQNTTWTGIAAGSAIAVGPPSTLTAGLIPHAIVTGTNTVAIEVCNLSGGSLTPGTISFTLADRVGGTSGGGGTVPSVISGFFTSGDSGGSCSFVLTTTTFTATGCSNSLLTGGLQSGSSTATHGWACFVNDFTDPSAIWGPSATSTTSVTFLSPNVSTSAHSVHFSCTAN